MSKPKQSHQKPMGPISALESKLALGNWTVFSVGFDGGASARGGGGGGGGLLGGAWAHPPPPPPPHLYLD